MNKLVSTKYSRSTVRENFLTAYTIKKKKNEKTMYM